MRPDKRGSASRDVGASNTDRPQLIGHAARSRRIALDGRGPIEHRPVSEGGWWGSWLRSGPPCGTVLEVSFGVPYAFQAPNGQPLEAGVKAQPPSSSGLGRRPFKAVARVRIPLGVHGFRVGFGRQGDHSKAPWRSWLARRPVTAEVAGSSPVGVAARAGSTPSGTGPFCWPGSSVGTSVRLKSGRSPVRSRPWPPHDPRPGQPRVGVFGLGGR
jgi:hypothetical protein